jgi:hypothetical protein
VGCHPGARHQHVKDLATRADCLLVGPSLEPAGSAAVARAVIDDLDVPVVLDALALAAVTQDPEGLRPLSGRVVLTLDPSELAQTLQLAESVVEQAPGVACARLADMTGAVVTVGGATSLAVGPDGRSWRDDGRRPGAKCLRSRRCSRRPRRRPARARITLVIDGDPFTVTATCSLASVMDAVQDVDGGPCVHAITVEERVEVDGLLSEQRWHLFAQAASDRGVRAALSFPIRDMGGWSPGGVNLYSGAPDAFAGPDRMIEAVSNADSRSKSGECGQRR